MEEKLIRVAITHGDTNGIGYELILKAFEDPMMLELCTPIIYGSPKAAAYHKKALNLETNYSIIATAEDAKEGRLNLLTCFDEEVKVELGQSSPESDIAAKKALERALQDAGKGLVDAIVTAPAKANKQIAKTSKTLSILVNEDLCMALVTKGLAIRDVADAITQPIIVEKATLFHRYLKRDRLVSNPRIAILALNPKVSEDEQEKSEEHTVIKPAIEELEQKGIQTFGPYPADEFFSTGSYQRFDGVLAMYYDQGMTPFKSLNDLPRVSIVAGLDTVCTSPDTDIHLDIAGQGTADPAAMRTAIYEAVDDCRNRRHYDEPMGNPLPKLYHEKRDDSEKARFNVSKGKPNTESPQEK
jgi:4-hydroxythreonine-4-phosphate dehydrogenase